MFIVHRWWERYGFQLIVAGLVLGTAWVVRETQGAAIAEMYYQVTRPLQIEPTPEEKLTDARVLELQNQLAELKEQNQKLKALLDYQDTQTQSGITAPIIGRSADHWWQQMTLGRGSNHGIQEGFVVTGIGGLVGRVVAVSPNTSRVLLISDPKSRVGVTISRSRHMGYLKGQRSNLLVLHFYDKVPDVKEGDVVTTSNVSQLFPPGISVGRIRSVNLDSSPAPEAIVELTAPMNSLEWVMLYPYQPNSATQ
ncbi:MAG: rod shape-determining protein MreC [Chroococcales cyanobacterium]